MHKILSRSMILLGLMVMLSYQNCAPPMSFSPVSGNSNVRNNVATEGSSDIVFNTAKPMVDILFVDDNSSSMSVKQQNLASRFSNFASGLANVDWQIAVTSTDVCASVNLLEPCGSVGARGQFFGPQGQSPKYGNQFILNAATPDVANFFGSIIQRNNELGSGDERAIYAANLVIDNRSTTASNFFREGSSFAVVIVSDEDERSVGGLNPSNLQYVALENYDLPQTLINKVRDTWNGKKSLLVNAIIDVPNDAACTGGSNPGNIYQELVKATGGVVGCINDSGDGAYTQMISNLGQAIQGQSLNITLDHIPLSKPIMTWTPSSNQVPISWTPGTNVLTMQSYPSLGTSLHMTYQY